MFLRGPPGDSGSPINMTSTQRRIEVQCDGSLRWAVDAARQLPLTNSSADCVGNVGNVGKLNVTWPPNGAFGLPVMLETGEDVTCAIHEFEVVVDGQYAIGDWRARFAAAITVQSENLQVSMQTATSWDSVAVKFVVTSNRRTRTKIVANTYNRVCIEFIPET